MVADFNKLFPKYTHVLLSAFFVLKLEINTSNIHYNIMKINVTVLANCWPVPRGLFKLLDDYIPNWYGLTLK